MASGRILRDISWIIGFVYLWIKFKGNKSFKELKSEAEENSFAIEGAKVILFIAGMIMLIPIVIFLLIFISRIIIEFFKNL